LEQAHRGNTQQLNSLLITSNIIVKLGALETAAEASTLEQS
jgi:hypothetical protein